MYVCSCGSSLWSCLPVLLQILHHCSYAMALLLCNMLQCGLRSVGDGCCITDLKTTSEDSWTTLLLYLQCFDSVAQCVSKKWCLCTGNGGELACLMLNSQRSMSCCDMTPRWLAHDGRRKRKEKAHTETREGDRVSGKREALCCFFCWLPNNEKRRRRDEGKLSVASSFLLHAQRPHAAEDRCWGRQWGVLLLWFVSQSEA